MSLPANESPRVVEFIGTPFFRVVCLPAGPIVEIADGRDALGETRWVRALLVPDRRGLGEEVLEGWKIIADALGATVRSAMRWARMKPYRLPVRYGIRGPYILKSLLRAWVTDRSVPATRAVKKPARRSLGKASHGKIQKDSRGKAHRGTT